MRSCTVFIALAIGCGGRAPVAESTTPAHDSAEASDRAEAPAAADRYVLLDAAASLFRSPDDDEPLVDNSAYEGARNAPHWTRSYRLIAERGDWLELETPGTTLFESDQCHSSSYAFDGARIRLFARRDRVFPVLTAPFTVDFTNGTSIALQRGVAVGALDDAEWRDVRWIRTGGFELAVPIPDDKLGWSYTTPEPFELPSQDGAWVSNSAFSEQVIWYAGGVKLGPAESELGAVRATDFVDIVEDRGDDILVELRTRCARVRAFVPADYVREPGGTDDVLATLSVSDSFDPPGVREGATAYWRGGDVAGEIVHARGFHAEVDADGARRCFRLVTKSRWIEGGPNGYGHSEPVSFAELCFDAGAVIDG